MLNVLRHIIQEVSSAYDFKEALEIMVKRIAHALNTQACSIFLLDRHHGEYVLAATQGLNPSAIGKVRVPLMKAERVRGKRSESKIVGSSKKSARKES